MIFSFNAAPGFDFMTAFARYIGAVADRDLLTIPDRLGSGYIRMLSFGPAFKITMHHYMLKEDLIIKRNASEQGNELITIFFYSNEQELDIAYNDDPDVRFTERDESAIQVTSNDLSSAIRFPKGQMIHYVVVAVTPACLKEMLAAEYPNTTLDTITGSGNSFLFFENMNAETKLLLRNLSAVDMNGELSHFYMRIKVQELLYFLFQKLSGRKAGEYVHMNSADAGRLLHIRNELVKDLSVPPVLRELAQIAAMSETKLKQLFRQAFGDSIYNYYQRARMEEAAFLLKRGRRSVAETGYELGFSNLSHFSRLFAKHYGTTPKRYATST